MRNLSLVFFTLFTQSAIGLVWVAVLTRWFGQRTPDISSISMITAFVISGAGLSMALAHLAKPRLAPHALRNIGFSWLSREVLLVQTFIGVVAFLILLSWLNVRGGGIIALEAAACLLGGAALFAMIRVYLLKTVPVWNSPATYLEFIGSAALLGGALGFVLSSKEGVPYSSWNTAILISGIAIVSGLILKIAGIFLGLAAARAARDQSWYETDAAPLSNSNILMARLLLFLIGSVMVMEALSQTGPVWLRAIGCLACFSTAEVLGRNYFYQSYRRVGL